MATKYRAHAHARHLQSLFPWTKKPLIVGAPMRIISSPALAVKVSEAGGLGFIGPGAQPSDLATSLEEAKRLLAASSILASHTANQSKPLLPLGIGFQTWAGDLTVAADILAQTHVAVIWLFAPRHGQSELDAWTQKLRQVSPDTQIWIQVASVRDAVAAASSYSRPDALVIQGSDAGGHSLTQGAGIITLLPEVSDALENLGADAAQIPLIAAGGIIDSRAASAVLTLGASGITIGTRLLASPQAKLHKAYQAHILSAVDGGQTTVRTQLYNHLRGTVDWPEGFDARGIANLTWREHREGVSFEVLKERHEVAVKKGGEAWGDMGRTATYAGTGIGLITEVKDAGEIVSEVRDGIAGRLEDVGEILRE